MTDDCSDAVLKRCPWCGWTYWTTDETEACRRPLCPLPISLQVLTEGLTLLLVFGLAIGWWP